jgi:CheY-like chemotaxis protein
LFARNRTVIAIVVTDMMMAGMDGPSLVKAVRKIDPAARIIGISGGREQTDLNVIQSLKLSGFLMKPFTAEKLLTVLQMVLQAQPGTKGGEPSAPAPGSY